MEWMWKKVNFDFAPFACLWICLVLFLAFFADRPLPFSSHPFVDFSLKLLTIRCSFIPVLLCSVFRPALLCILVSFLSSPSSSSSYFVVSPAFLSPLFLFPFFCSLSLSLPFCSTVDSCSEELAAPVADQMEKRIVDHSAAVASAPPPIHSAPPPPHLSASKIRRALNVTNVCALKFGALKYKDNLFAGDPVFCANCHAVLNQTRSLLFHHVMFPFSSLCYFPFVSVLPSCVTFFLLTCFLPPFNCLLCLVLFAVFRRLSVLQNKVAAPAFAPASAASSGPGAVSALPVPVPGSQLWMCEFCGHANEVNLDAGEVPSGMDR